MHKALEYGAYIRAVTFQGNILRRYAALEDTVAKLQSSGIVTKADGIVPLAPYTISHLLAVGDGNVGIDSSFFQITQQSGILQRSHPNIIEDGFFLFIPLWMFYYGKRISSVPCNECRPQEEILASDELSCQVEDVSAFANAKVELYVSIYINLEGRVFKI